MPQFAQTVTGRVSASQLGWVLMHEHVLCDLRDPAIRGGDNDDPDIILENRFQTDYFQNRNPCNTVLDEVEIAASELKLFREAGGATIVELTLGGLDPKPLLLAELSRETGAQLICGAGYYVDAYQTPEVRQSSIDELEAVIIGQLVDGSWGSEIRAGLIGEIGCSWPLAESERKILIAAARAQIRTGAAISIHPGRHPDAPAEIADILVAAGADPNLTIIGHMDRTIFDRDRLVALLNRGFVLEWDFFGIETSQYWMAGEDLDLPTDYMRLDLIKALMRSGFSEQIAISHDICTKTRLCAYGGHGYRHIPLNIVPMMNRRGFSQSDIDQILHLTPARLLCYLTDPASDTAQASPS